MSKEFELIYALCEALGFEVETELDYMPRKETIESAREHNSGFPNKRSDRVLASIGPHNKLDIDEDEMYTSLLISPVVSYKLTRNNQ
jgi:hypothetical protein